MTITGISYPLNIVNGQLQTSSDVALVADHIKAVLETETQERLGRANFGLPDYTFSGYPDFLRVGSDIQERLENTIPEAQFSVKSALGDDGIGRVVVEWAYRGEQDRISLEFT